MSYRVWVSPDPAPDFVDAKLSDYSGIEELADKTLFIEGTHKAFGASREAVDAYLKYVLETWGIEITKACVYDPINYKILSEID